MAEVVQAYDWEITAGDDEVRTFEIQDSAGDAIDVSARTYTAEFRTARGQASTTTAAATASCSVASPLVQVTLTAAQTRDLGDNGRRYFWDLQETDENGAVRTRARGVAVIVQDVTR